MRKHLQYIFLALATVVLAVSCVKELEFEQPMGEGDALTLVPRVRSFANQYVTKATPYDGDKGEKNITRLAVFVFNSKGDLIHWYEDTSGSDAVTLNKSMLNSPAQSSMLDNATVVLIANVNLDDVKKGTVSIKDNSALTLDDLENYTINTSGTVFTEADLKAEDFSGLPMIGGIKVDLTHAAGSQDVEVGMKILYAKIKFNLSVAAGTENQGSGMKFDLTGYSVHNTSTATTLAIPANMGEKPVDFLGNEKADAVQATVDVATASNVYQTDAKDVENAASTSTSTDGIEFTFYIPESRYNHNLEIGDLQTVYPTDWCTNDPSQDVKNYQTGQRLNKVKYFYDDLTQQFKPKIAEKTGSTKAPQPGAGLATYVLLKGSYTDYKGDIWDLKYKVYLGKDNDQNFHVDRNSIYTNNITIKGIRNNDSYGTDQVWVDHRVDVSTTTDNAKYVTITRETLVDAHFEVRPLRVNFPDGINRAFLYLPKYDGAQKEETATGTNENWIAIENNNGRVKDITQYSSNGKRKYFTTSLIKQLYLENNDETYGIRTNNVSGDPRNGQKYIQLFDGDCAWIYIDENVKGGEREAIIELIFYDEDGNALSDVESFRIKQQGLYTTSSGFKIENYEEYLHTYDSQDLYTNPLTDYTQQGYKWGLEGTNLSKSQNVVLSGNTPSDSYYYDFFHSKDRENSNAIGSLGTYEVVGGNIEDNHGLNFTNNAGISNEMTIIDMNTRPSSAIQYCLSRNKFEVDESADEKHKMDVHWYLPDVYEMTQILNEGKRTFPDFGENIYWSSQPAWKTPQNLSGLNYLVDDEDNARAVSIEAATAEKYTGTNAPRSNKHRIRCAYSAEGIKDVDFSGSRAPEGIGAMRFYMRAWKDWDTKEKGYFSWDDCLYEDINTVVTNYALPDTYPFPKEAADADEYFGPYVDGYGFAKDPSDSENWKTETVNSIYTSNLTLYKWPGLTTSQVVSKNTVIGSNVYYDLDGTKEEWKGTVTTYATKYSDDITTSQLNYLDHMFGGSDLSIGFMTGDGVNSPKFEYYKENSVESKKITRTWLTPKYVSKDKVESEVKGPIYTPSGKIILTADEESDRASKSGTIQTNEEGYIYPDEQSAITAGHSIVPSGAYDISVVAEKSSKDWLNREITIYTYQQSSIFGNITQYARAPRYRYKVTYTLDGQNVTYYQYDKDGCWEYGEEQSETVPNTDPPTDQLVMYGGNSFTIKANNDNEISSVKIYFSGSNVVDVLGSGKDYLRFTKDGFTGSSNQNPPGMTYSGDGDKGTMTWSGDPQSELTFKLVVIRKVYDNYGLWGDPTSFQYIANTEDSKDESIVIDQIDVRYKKKSSSAQ